VTGGPLYDGDIEECDGKTRIVCPWHGYAFDVQSGMTDFGLPVSLESRLLPMRHSRLLPMRHSRLLPMRHRVAYPLKYHTSLQLFTYSTVAHNLVPLRKIIGIVVS